MQLAQSKSPSCAVVFLQWPQNRFEKSWLLVDLLKLFVKKARDLYSIFEKERFYIFHSNPLKIDALFLFLSLSTASAFAALQVHARICE